MLDLAGTSEDRPSHDVVHIVHSFIQRQEENIQKRDSLIGEYAAEYEFEGGCFSSSNKNEPRRKKTGLRDF